MATSTCINRSHLTNAVNYVSFVALWLHSNNDAPRIEPQQLEDVEIQAVDFHWMGWLCWQHNYGIHLLWELSDAHCWQNVCCIKCRRKGICDFPILYFVFQFTRSWSSELAAISSLLHECKGYTLNIGIEPEGHRPEGECQYYDVHV